MSFYVYTGNRLENLAESFCSEVMGNPLKGNPLKPETVVVQNKGMAEWLKQYIADKNGICANINFLFVKNFTKKILESTTDELFLPYFDFFEPETLTLSIYKHLKCRNVSHPDLTQYIEGDQEELKRFQLSEKIAQTFDQYQMYRSEMILNWEDNKETDDEKWQAELWRLLVKDNHKSLSFGLTNFLQCGSLKKPDMSRISVFGISAMPPLFLNIFKKFGSIDKTDVHFYYLNLFRIAGKKSLTKSNVVDNTNYLLKAFGDYGMEFQELLLGDKSCIHKSLENAGVYLGRNILTSLQEDVYFNKVIKSDGSLFDQTVSVHSCHNKLREIEVLYDQVLHVLNNNPKIQPKDIIVAAPNISEYVPYITAVLDRKNSEYKTYNLLPYSFSDISITQTSKIINTFFAILELIGTKFRTDDILNILESESVRQKFEIKDDKDLSYIRKWVSETGMCWGIDDKDRVDSGFEDFGENTLSSGKEKLLLGYLVDDSFGVLKEKLIPYREIALSQGTLLGGFAAFIKSIFELKSKLSNLKTIEQWHFILTDVINTFFQNDNESFEDISKISKSLNQLFKSSRIAEFNELLSIETVRASLLSKLNTEILSDGFLRGKITFCTMQPMRNIPSEVLYLIGMNQGVYPRKETKIGFDLIDKGERRNGDRSKRMEDRYIFLETLIAARKYYFISYIGQSNHTNENIPPAAPVRELTDYLNTKYGEEQVSKIKYNHRLNSFNSVYFSDIKTKFYSYSNRDCNAAKALSSDIRPRTLFPNTIKATEITEITIDNLISFFKNTSKYIFTKRLNSNLKTSDSTIINKNEPFNLNGLELYFLNQEIIKRLINKKDCDSLYDIYKLEDKLPVKFNGRLLFEEQLSNVRSMYENSFTVNKIKLGSPREQLAGTSNLPLNITFGDIKLTGTLNNVISGDRQVFFEVASESASRKLESWLRHIIFNASGCGGGKTICFIGKKPKECFKNQYPAIEQNEALLKLQELISLYIKGQEKPLAFLPEASFSFANNEHEKKIEKAVSKILGSEYVKGDLEDIYTSMCFDKDIVKSEEFQLNSKTIFSHFWKD